MTNEHIFDASSSFSLLEFIERLFTADFMPHGHCFFWRKDLLWLHVLSDAVIAVSYYAIPMVIIYFVLKRRDIPFHWIFLMFGAFIVACGTTHLMSIVTMWNGAYRIEGVIKLLTAVISAITACLLIPLLPKLLALPSQSALNIHLEKKTKDLERVNKELEQFNRFTLGREARIIELKQEVNKLLSQLGEEQKYKVTDNFKDSDGKNF